MAVDRESLATEADLYIEPGSIDSFEQRFDVTYTYSDGITTKGFVVAHTHTSDKLKIDAGERPARPAPWPPVPRGERRA